VRTATLAEQGRLEIRLRDARGQMHVVPPSPPESWAT
jgi:hypothetical protein